MAIKIQNDLISLGEANGYYRLSFGKTSRIVTGKVQRISLGIKVSSTNFEKAVTLANEIGKIYAKDVENSCVDPTFKRYAPKTNEVFNKFNTYEFYLKNLERSYFETRKRTGKSENTFYQLRADLEKSVKAFLTATVTPENIKDIILATPHGTRKRTKLVGHISVMLNCFFELKQLSYSLPYKLSDFNKDYKPKTRSLPTDEQIIEGFYRIQEAHDKNPWAGKTTPYFIRLASWGWVYGILATYGLRPHELLAIDIDNSFETELNELTLDENLCDGIKTGSRIVYPLKPDWVDLFGLKDVKHPEKRNQLTIVLHNKIVRKVDTKKQSTSSDEPKNVTSITNVISDRFKVKTKPIKAYDLRHAYAVRGYVYNVSIGCMAKLMGHSIEMHEKIYQKYIPGWKLKEPYADASKYYKERIDDAPHFQLIQDENKALGRANQKLLRQNHRLLAEVSRMRKLVPPEAYSGQWEKSK